MLCVRFVVSLLELTFLLGHDLNDYYPTPEDFNNSIIASSFIHDDFWKMVMQQQFLFCPNHNYCSQMFNRSIPYPIVDCCKPCSCNITNCAILGDCCPNILIPNVTEYDNNLDNPLNVPEEKTTCIYPQVLKAHKKINLNSKHSYIMITACPVSFKNDNVSLACEQGDFLRKDGDELNFPVTSAVTAKVFRNKDCAICHGENTSDLLLWKTGLICENILSSYSFQEVKMNVLFNKICNILFLPPIPAAECDWGVISSCNITGQWKHYDKQIEKACLSYTHVYMIMYRNIFCAMCNGVLNMFVDCEDLINPPRTLFTFSFTAILDFMDNSLPEKISSQNCKGNEFFDEFMNECLPVYCNQMMYYDAENLTCSPVFHQLSNAKYNITATYQETSNNEFCSNCTDEIVSSIYNQIKNFLATVGLLQTLCEVNILVESKVQPRFFVVQFSIYIKDLHYFVNSIQLFLNFFSNETSITTSSGSTFVFLRKVLGKAGWPISFGGTFTNKSSVFILPDQRLLYLFAYYQENGYYTCFSKIIFEVSHLLLCKQVKLPSSLQYEIQLELVFNKSGYSISSSYFKIKPATNEVIMCLDSYEHALGEMKITDPDVSVIEKAEQIVSLVFIWITIVSLVVTILTYALFKNLRTAPGFNNLALSVTLLVANILFGFSSNFAHLKHLCETIGALSHLFWLSSILWMNVCCIHMFNVFKSIDKALMNNEIFPRFYKYLLYSFLVPIVFVCINISYSEAVKGDIGYGGSLCYIKHRLMNLATFASPVAIIILSNIIMFITAIFKIHSLKDAPTSTAHKLNFSIYAKLSTLTGVTWVFGYVYELSGVRFFSFAFIILSASQGFYIMVAFILNRRVLNLYKTLVSKKKLPILHSHLTESKQTSLNANSKPMHYSANDHIITTRL